MPRSTPLPRSVASSGTGGVSSLRTPSSLPSAPPSPGPTRTSARPHPHTVARDAPAHIQVVKGAARGARVDAGAGHAGLAHTANGTRGMAPLGEAGVAELAWVLLPLLDGLHLKRVGNGRAVVHAAGVGVCGGGGRGRRATTVVTSCAQSCTLPRPAPHAAGHTHQRRTELQAWRARVGGWVGGRSEGGRKCGAREPAQRAHVTRQPPPPPTLALTRRQCRHRRCRRRQPARVSWMQRKPEP